MFAFRVFLRGTFAVDVATFLFNGGPFPTNFRLSNFRACGRVFYLGAVHASVLGNEDARFAKGR